MKLKSASHSKYRLHCYGCGADLEAAANYTCAVCGEPLALEALGAPAPSVFRQPPQSLWDYFDLLPIQSRSNAVSLGEGATPLLHAPRLAQSVGCGELLLKNETVNPTGSFKDRQVSVGISRAKEIGASTVAVVSSGNVACAAAAYAARAGLRAVLMMHGHAAPTKMAQATAYGGRVLQVDVPEASTVFTLCVEACATLGWYHLSTAGMYEPFNVEGAKTIAYELYQQTEGRLPDWIVAPVGGGGLLGGIWRGFLDLQRLGLIESIPRLAGVQADGCAPLTKAIDQGTRFLDTLKEPWPNPKTIAGGIADDILFDGHTVLPAIRSTGGKALAVSDAEIVEGELRLAAQEGILCEPSSAVVIAALNQLPIQDARCRVCCIVTGSGIKDLPILAGRVQGPTQIADTVEAIIQSLGDYDA